MILGPFTLSYLAIEMAYIAKEYVITEDAMWTRMFSRSRKRIPNLDNLFVTISIVHFLKASIILSKNHVRTLISIDRDVSHSEYCYQLSMLCNTEFMILARNQKEKLELTVSVNMCPDLDTASLFPD